MNRMTWLTASLFVGSLAALAGCGGGVTSTADGAAGAGGTAAGGGAGGAAGAAGAGGTAAGGHAGAGLAGTNGAAGAAAGGHAGAGLAGTNGAAGAAAGGHAGAGLAGTNGAAGAAAGGHAGGGAGGGPVVCADQAACGGDNCQTACGADGKATFCTCIPAGNNTMQFSCTTFACARDGGPTPFPACPADVTNQPDCQLAADTVCATACAAQKQTECACVPHGGGGNGRWMCGPPATCQ